MLLQRAMTSAALVGLIGMPYFLSQRGGPDESAMPGEPQIAAVAGSALSAGEPQVVMPGESHYPARLVGAPVPIEQIFRFDIGFEQILHTWPTVTTATNQLDLKGYRVALVTGNMPESLAGVLTYYFNQDQQLQRIVFHGRTGDPRPLTRLMIDRFGFLSERSDAAMQRYQARSGGEAVSELRVQPAQIVDASQPHRRFDVHLTLDRPPSGSGWFSWLWQAE